jgi:hypothetical protein
MPARRRPIEQQSHGVFMETVFSDQHRVKDESPAAQDTITARGHSRRAVVREGMKLAFVAPALTTFFAREARAAGSNHSCYPEGHLCDGTHTGEECCAGLQCTGTQPKTCK